MSTWRTADAKPFNPHAHGEVYDLRSRVRELKEENAELRARIAELELELDCAYADLKEDRQNV